MCSEGEKNRFGIATAHMLASDAGRDVLTSGGNAFDAAVAAAVALAVVEPGNSGVGGEGYCIFYDARTNKTGALCFMEEPPSLVTAESVYGKELFRGVLAPMVPGAVPGWFALLSEKCTRSAADLFGPAIDFAREGFNIASGEAGALNWMADQFHSSAREIFCRTDRPWKEGDRLRQPDLARTLEDLAKEGPEFMHSGAVGECINKFFQGAGGLIRADDLAAYQVRWQDTLSARFNNTKVHVPLPESTGFGVLFGLKLLEAIGIQNMSLENSGYVRTMLSVLRKMDLAVGELSRRFSPYDKHVPEEVNSLLKMDHIREVAGDLANRKDVSYGPTRSCHTTSLSVADRYGNLICLTQTLDDGYGSGVVVPGTGILLNNGMAWVETDPAKNSAELVGPRKHFFVPVVPTISLTTSQLPSLALGTPGGNGIPQTTVQVLAHFLFFRDDIETAIDRPRMVVGAMTPRLDAGVKLEEGFSRKAYDSLGQEPIETDWAFGRFHGVQVLEDGSIVAFADSRRPGVAYCG